MASCSPLRRKRVGRLTRSGPTLATAKGPGRIRHVKLTYIAAPDVRSGRGSCTPMPLRQPTCGVLEALTAIGWSARMRRKSARAPPTVAVGGITCDRHVDE